MGGCIRGWMFMHVLECVCDSLVAGNGVEVAWVPLPDILAMLALLIQLLLCVGMWMVVGVCESVRACICMIVHARAYMSARMISPQTKLHPPPAFIRRFACTLTPPKPLLTTPAASSLPALIHHPNWTCSCLRTARRPHLGVERQLVGPAALARISRPDVVWCRKELKHPLFLKVRFLSQLTGPPMLRGLALFRFSQA